MIEAKHDGPRGSSLQLALAAQLGNTVRSPPPSFRRVESGVEKGMLFDAVDAIVEAYTARKENRKRKFGSNATSPSDVLPWSWVAQTLIALLLRFPRGVTKTIINSEIFTQWDEHKQAWQSGSGKVWSIHELKTSKRIPSSAVVEAVVKGVMSIPGTETQLVELSDPPDPEAPEKPRESIEWYLHGKFSSLCSKSKTSGACLSEGRVIRLVGCRTVRSVGGDISAVRLLPNELAAIVLDPRIEQDAENLSEGLVSDDISRVSHQAAGAGESYILRLSVHKVCEASPILLQEGNYVMRRRCYLKDHTSGGSHKKLIALMLWEAQCDLGNLFNTGQEIILERPVVKCEGDPNGDLFRLEIGPETVIYLVDGTSDANKQRDAVTSPNPRSPSVVAQTLYSQTQGKVAVLDMSHNDGRTRISDLSAGMKGICIMAWVKSVKGNIKSNGKDRYVIALVDDSGVRELHCWDEAGYMLAPLLEGQAVMLRGLHTTPKKQGVPDFWLKAELPELHIQVISNLPGLMRTPYICPAVSLAQAIHMPSAVVKATLAEWEEFPSEFPCIARDVTCPRCTRACPFDPLAASVGTRCEHCRLDIPEGSPGACVGVGSLSIEDWPSNRHDREPTGSSQGGEQPDSQAKTTVETVLSPTALNFILGLASASEVAGIEDVELSARLAALVGREYMMLLCKLQIQGSEQVRFRIDSISAVDEAETHRLQCASSTGI